MIRLILQVILKARQLYWFVVRPKTRGVRAIVVDEYGKVLLVKHRYGQGWYLPGGGVGSGETSENALKRELKEEVGIIRFFDEERLGIYVNEQEYKVDTITVFVLRCYEIEDKKHMEVDQKKFFDPYLLPLETSPGTKRRIEEYLGIRVVTAKW
jgi:8-oxo-dGTP pyrophosphatase MutT (NUDIX family)